MSDIILFDMDGTITPPRKPMTAEMCDSLQSIIDAGHEIGIVTGSDMDFLTEQCALLFERDLHKVIHFWPCNGSKYYIWDEDFQDLKLEYSIDMRETIGESNFKSLIFAINKAHYEGMAMLETKGLPITARYTTFRKSAINYCPIGRDYNQEGRKLLTEHEDNISIRLSLLEEIYDYYHMGMDLNLKDRGNWELEFVLGGKVSIDIYPKGFGKEYVLTQINKRLKNIWFIGDNVGGWGNDTTIYNELSSSNHSFETSGPEQTTEIISNILDRLASGE